MSIATTFGAWIPRKVSHPREFRVAYSATLD
jgi:hypothetical protein